MCIQVTTAQVSGRVFVRDISSACFFFFWLIVVKIKYNNRLEKGKIEYFSIRYMSLITHSSEYAMLE